MEDIISYGDGRPPRPRRRKVMVTIALVAVVTLAVLTHLPHGHPHHAADTSRRPVSTIRVTSIPGWAAAIRLPRTGAQPAWFTPANGASRPIGGLPKGSGYDFTQVSGGWVIQPRPPRAPDCGDCAGVPAEPGSAVLTGCTDCPGPPVPVYYLGDSARSATTIGVATVVAPAAASAVAWLTDFPPGAGLGSAPGVAREYDASGHALGAAVHLPAGYAIVRGTRRGLLLAPLAGPQRASGTERLWNPVTGRFAQTFRAVIATDPSEVAYRPAGACGHTTGTCRASGCQGSCAVRLVSLISGRAVTFQLPPGDTAVSGSFSPDGRFIAVRVGFGSGTSGATELEVAPVTAARLTAVPNTWVSRITLIGFGWPGPKDELVAELAFPIRRDLVFADPADSAQAITELTAAQDPLELITGGN